MNSDYFHPHILLRSLKDDFKTYKKAVSLFFGFDIKPQVVLAKPSQSLRVDGSFKGLTEEEEFNLLHCILADQHELSHYFQYISTSFGINHWLLNVLYWDFTRELASELLKARHNNGLLSELRLINFSNSILNSNEQKHQKIKGLYHVVKGLDFQRKIFDNPYASIYTATTHWNLMSDFLDKSRINPDDNVIHCKFKIPNNQNELANPNGITLLSLLECLARCHDFILLKNISASEIVKHKMLLALNKDKVYTIVFNNAAKIIPAEKLIIVLIKIIGFSLQSPLSSLHIDLEKENYFDWKTLSPSWRFLTLLNLIKSNKDIATQIVEDEDFPDGFCKEYGWPSILNQRLYFLGNEIYMGRDKMVRFVMNQHINFCKFASVHNKKPIHFQDTSIDFTDNLKDFFPPFHFANNDLIIHETCKDFSELIDIYLVLLTSTIAREVLYCDSINDSNQLLKTFSKWGNSIKKGFGDQLVNEIWTSTFKSMFGIDFNQLSTFQS